MIDVDLGPAATGMFTTRAGGVSAPPYRGLNLGGASGDDPQAVRQNRIIAEQMLGAPVTFADQVHGIDVLEPDQEQGQADVVLGTDRAVGVLVADCVPVLLAAPGVVAAVHAGRRGLLAGVVQAALQAFDRRGAPVTHAAIGPAICGQCYEVPEVMRAEAVAHDPVLGSRTSWGTPAIDLTAGVHAILRRAGVGHIEDVRRCSFTDARLYSYRRDGRTGRFAGLVSPRHMEGRDTPQ